ncbi:MAG: GHMP kinase [Acidobacteriota bacterium]|nr:GHMP kinase [Acidobacteriota bacterium]
MYRIVQNSPQNLPPDVAEFIETLNALEQNRNEKARKFFDKSAEIFVARAPGRLDVMGGIADYSGSLVLQMPIAEAVCAALQKDEARRLKFLSLGAAENNRTDYFEINLADFEPNGKIISYSSARKLFDGANSWAAYAAGAFLVLMREKNARFTKGARILIDSKVPEGKGVSSSAAIEAAAMKAIQAAFEIEIEPRETALLCQTVENSVVGAPCGIMDQMAVICGEENKLLRLLCQPAELEKSLPIPDEIEFWGIDSGVRHSVGAGDYGSVRTGAFIGYRIVADLLKFKINETDIENFVEIEDEKYGGFLANITPAEFEKNFAAHLPEKISGADFLARYKGISDAATKIAAEKIYPVFNPTAHPIYENSRVRRFSELLSEPLSEKNLLELGELMYQSHVSYTTCGLGSAETNLLAEIAKNKNSIYGAKITGGGSGGTAAILGRRGADAEIEQIAAEYKQKTNCRPHIFSGSSGGAASFGFLKLKRIN